MSPLVREDYRLLDVQVSHWITVASVVHDDIHVSIKEGVKDSYDVNVMSILSRI